MFPTLEQLEEATTVCVMRETEVRILNTGRRKNELRISFEKDMSMNMSMCRRI